MKKFRAKVVSAVLCTTSLLMAYSVAVLTNPLQVYAGTPEIIIDGKVVQESSGPSVSSGAQSVLDNLARYQKQLESDKKKGVRWVYSNKNKYKEEWYDDALSTGKRGVNCALLARWALRDAGILNPGEGGFWGEKHSKIHWQGKGEKYIKDRCDLIYIGGKKTVKQLMDDRTLLPGDILTYHDIGHTNIYAGDGYFYDAGHTFCSGSGELAKFNSFYGKCSTKHKVGYIIRVKEDIVIENVDSIVNSTSDNNENLELDAVVVGDGNAGDDVSRDETSSDVEADKEIHFATGEVEWIRE